MKPVNPEATGGLTVFVLRLCSRRLLVWPVLHLRAQVSGPLRLDWMHMQVSGHDRPVREHPRDRYGWFTGE